MTWCYVRCGLGIQSRLGPVDKPTLAPTRPERPGRCNADAAPRVTSCSADSTGKQRIKGRRAGVEKEPGVPARDSFRCFFASGDSIDRLAVNLDRPLGKLEADSDPRTDERRRVGDLRALADYALLAWRASAEEPSAQAGWHTLDLPDRSAVARLAASVRQMELRVEAIPPLVRVRRLGPLASGAG